ncbi:hypothetical protein EMIT0P260_20194 [Pseudomonas sp. IT-P260]
MQQGMHIICMAHPTATPCKLRYLSPTLRELKCPVRSSISTVSTARRPRKRPVSWSR